MIMCHNNLLWEVFGSPLHAVWSLYEHKSSCVYILGRMFQTIQLGCHAPSRVCLVSIPVCRFYKQNIRTQAGLKGIQCLEIEVAPLSLTTPHQLPLENC